MSRKSGDRSGETEAGVGSQKSEVRSRMLEAGCRESDVGSSSMLTNPKNSANSAFSARVIKSEDGRPKLGDRSGVSGVGCRSQKSDAGSRMSRVGCREFKHAHKPKKLCELRVLCEGNKV